MGTSGTMREEPTCGLRDKDAEDVDSAGTFSALCALVERRYCAGDSVQALTLVLEVTC